MTTCVRLRARLAEYYYSDLDQEKSAEVREHLEVCTVCGREFELLRRALDSIPRSAEEKVPSEIKDQIKKHLRPQSRKAGFQTPGIARMRWMPAVASIAAVFVIGILALHFLSSREDRDRRPQEQEIAENLEILENMELLEMLDIMEEVMMPGNGTPRGNNHELDH